MFILYKYYFLFLKKINTLYILHENTQNKKIKKLKKQKDEKSKNETFFKAAATHDIMTAEPDDPVREGYFFDYWKDAYPLLLKFIKENNPDATVSQNQGTYISTAELSTSLALMKSFANVITKSDECYSLALTEAHRLQNQGYGPLSAEYTVESFKGSTKVSYDDELIILTITVTTGNKNDSHLLVSALANVAPEYICSCIGRTSSMKLNVDVGAQKVSPNTTLICLALVLIGIVGSITFIWISETLDKTIKNDEDFTSHYDIPLLGSIPEFGKTGKKRRT